MADLPVPKRLRGRGAASAASVVQERNIAKRVGGRVQPGSGNGPRKADVQAEGRFRVEAKSTTKKSFGVSRKLIQTIREQASNGELPVIQIDFVDEHGRVVDGIVAVPIEHGDLIYDRETRKTSES